MAKRKKNKIDLKDWVETHGSDFVIKVRDGKPYISRKAKRDPNRKKSDSEQKQVNYFREAVKYAKEVIADENLQKEYVLESGKTGRSIYHLAISNFIDKKKEEAVASEVHIEDIVAEKSGGHIFLKINFKDAADFRKIAVVLSKKNQAFIERGTAEQASSASWWYHISDASVASDTFRVFLKLTAKNGEITNIERIVN